MFELYFLIFLDFWTFGFLDFGFLECWISGCLYSGFLCISAHKELHFRVA